PAAQGQRTDGQIEMDVVKALDASSALTNDLITAATIQSEVTLSGTVATEADKDLAGSIASRVDGVSKVHNNLQIGNPQQAAEDQGYSMGGTSEGPPPSPSDEAGQQDQSEQPGLADQAPQQGDDQQPPRIPIHPFRIQGRTKARGHLKVQTRERTRRLRRPAVLLIHRSMVVNIRSPIPARDRIRLRAHTPARTSLLTASSLSPTRARIRVPMASSRRPIQSRIQDRTQDRTSSPTTACPAAR